MAQLSNDCFAFGGGLMSLEEVRALIAARVAVVAEPEDIDLAAADGRVLAADVHAGVPLPPFANSAVDGYAVRFDDLAPAGETRLRVLGRIPAGRVAEAAPPGVAVRIFTGAPMPEGLDTVFMQEDVRREGETVVLPPGLARGANARPAGEDLPEGALALAAGRRLGPREIALLAALGLARVSVRRRLAVALFSTGDELAQPGAPLPPAKLYDSNRYALAALLRRLGASVSDLGALPDERARLGAALREAARGHDLLVTSGGVSTGEEDHVRAAVESVGALTFWRVAVKPGRPVALGVVDGTPFVGLPGNPVAAFVTFTQIARALVARLSGEAWSPPAMFPVRAAFAYRKKEGRREFVRARLAVEEDGTRSAHKHPREGAGILTSLTETDGLVVLPESCTRVAPGDAVLFCPYEAMI